MQLVARAHLPSKCASATNDSLSVTLTKPEVLSAKFATSPDCFDLVWCEEGYGCSCVKFALDISNKEPLLRHHEVLKSDGWEGPILGMKEQKQVDTNSICIAIATLHRPAITFQSCISW